MPYVDSILLAVTERCCRRFQLLTGRTNVWVAVQLTNLSIVVYFVWAVLYFWRTGPIVRLLVGIFCSGLLYALTLTVFRVPIETYEDEAYRRAAKGLRNPRRMRDVGLRLSFLTLSIVLCYPVLFVYFTLRLRLVLLTYSLVVLTTVLLYVLACDPLPPSAGRVKEWLRGLARSRRRATDVTEPLAPGGAERRRVSEAEFPTPSVVASGGVQWLAVGDRDACRSMRVNDR